MTKQELSPNQSLALSLIRDEGAKGICTRYVWKFTSGHTTITGAVKVLAAKGYVTVTYYRDSASVDLTDKGRACFDDTQRAPAVDLRAFVPFCI